MKYLATLLTLAFLFSCNQQKVTQMENEISQLKQQNEIIREQSAIKDNFVEEYTTTLNEVYDNLDNIRKREGLISEYSRTLENNEKGSLKKKMLSNIESIDDYITKSKSRLSAIRARYKEADMASKAFEQTIEKLTKELEDREVFIASLKTQVDSLNQEVLQATFALRERELIIDEQTDQMNKAFFVIGTDDELEEKSIITEKGGILGLGSTTVVSSELNDDDFNKTDISQTAVINIEQNVDDIEIISSHDPQSYQLSSVDENISKLEITNPQQFWKMRYLVIITKG